MSCTQRANTWEISESENEAEENKPSSCVKLKQDTSVNESNTSRTEDSSSGRKRRRKRPEEQQDTKKTAKEKLKEDKNKIKEDKNKIKDEKEKLKEEKNKLKEEKLQDRQRRKDAAVKLNLLKPENVIKSLTVHIHAVLLRDGGCDVLLRTLDGLQWRNRIENEGLPNSISWTRQALQTEDEEKHAVIEEDQLLMVISPDELEDMLSSHKTVSNLSAPIGEIHEGAESLLQHLYKYLSRTEGKVVTILVIGYQRRSASWDEDELDFQLNEHHMDTEELLVHLQLYWNITVRFLSSWQEVTNHVVAVTKALSKRPYKALCVEPDLGFCMDGSWSAGVRVDRDGRGLAQVWTRQIQQLNRVSTAVAKTVTSAFPSPSLLLQAYDELPSGEEPRKLLADLMVVGGANERRVGPELAGRIHRLLTSQNPQLLLD
ncbi:probable crossover junction endonuclease EME2 isoform X1 [Danio rerio]|uniref:Probable crossover junction endonuclease EME2 isoform X1 n=2 Tax=Danio rerio TaxID=7955 RepID=A0AC58IST5_DANRE